MSVLELHLRSTEPEPVAKPSWHQSPPAWATPINESIVAVSWLHADHKHLPYHYAVVLLQQIAVAIQLQPVMLPWAIGNFVQRWLHSPTNGVVVLGLELLAALPIHNHEGAIWRTSHKIKEASNAFGTSIYVFLCCSNAKPLP